MKKKLLYLALFLPLAGFAQSLDANFEDGVVPPTGWTIQQTNTSETWRVNSALEAPAAGNYSALVAYDAALADQNELLITPSLDFSAATTVALNFKTTLSYYWSVSPNDNYDVSVEVSTDGGMSWTPVWSEVDLGTFVNWTVLNINVDLSSYAGSPDVQIGFRYVGNDGASWTIDDINLVTCIAPTAPAIADITTDSASLTFTGNSPGYELEYGVSGFTQGSGTVETLTDEAFAFSGLEGATTYQYYIRSVCSETSQSSWAGPFSFTTSCGDVAEVPMMQDFESAVVPGMPGCTSTENAGTGNNWTVASPNGYGFTTKTLRYAWNTTSAANAWFFTQPVNLTAGQSYTLTYKYGSASASAYPESLKVSYGTSASSSAMAAEPLADHPAVLNNVTPITNTVSFTPATSGVYHIGFNAYSAADMFYLFVDDIALDVTLGTQQFDASKLSVFPNPVKNALNLSYNQNISSVEIYNLLGQQMTAEKVNANQKQIDMSNYASGTYLVKVFAGDMVKTIKVVKE